MTRTQAFATVFVINKTLIIAFFVYAAYRCFRGEHPTTGVVALVCAVFFTALTLFIMSLRPRKAKP